MYLNIQIHSLWFCLTGFVSTFFSSSGILIGIFSSWIFLFLQDLCIRRSSLESSCQVPGAISNPRPIKFLSCCIWDHTSSVNSIHKSMGLWACGYKVSKGNCTFTHPDLHVLPRTVGGGSSSNGGTFKDPGTSHHDQTSNFVPCLLG